MPVFLIIFVVRKEVSNAAVAFLLIIFTSLKESKALVASRICWFKVFEVINFVCYPTIILVWWSNHIADHII